MLHRAGDPLRTILVPLLQQNKPQQSGGATPAECHDTGNENSQLVGIHGSCLGLNNSCFSLRCSMVLYATGRTLRPLQTSSGSWSIWRCSGSGRNRSAILTLEWQVQFPSKKLKSKQIRVVQSSVHYSKKTRGKVRATPARNLSPLSPNRFILVYLESSSLPTGAVCNQLNYSNRSQNQFCCICKLGTGHSAVLN